MKKYLLPGAVMMLMLFFLPSIMTAQKKDSILVANVKEMIVNQRYVFKAQNVTPMAGRLRQLTSEYDLQVSKDQIVAYLPYFGRSYTAPLDPSKGGIQFSSKDFNYNISERKKGGWNVSIQTKDVSETQQMQLTIFKDGTASLQANSSSRQSISFNGYITNPDKKK